MIIVKHLFRKKKLFLNGILGLFVLVLSTGTLYAQEDAVSHPVTGV